MSTIIPQALQSRIIGHKTVHFQPVSGRVLSEKHWTKTDISSTGGSGRVINGTLHIDPPKVSSTTTDYQDIWIETSDNREQVLKFVDEGVNVRAGQVITAVKAVADNKTLGTDLLVNHSSQTWRFVGRDFATVIESLRLLPFSNVLWPVTSVIFLLVLPLLLVAGFALDFAPRYMSWRVVLEPFSLIALASGLVLWLAFAVWLKPERHKRLLVLFGVSVVTVNYVGNSLAQYGLSGLVPWEFVEFLSVLGTDWRSLHAEYGNELGGLVLEEMLYSLSRPLTSLLGLSWPVVPAVVLGAALMVVHRNMRWQRRIAHLVQQLRGHLKAVAQDVSQHTPEQVLPASTRS